MVDDELDDKKEGDDEDKEQGAQPGKKIDAEEYACKQAINSRFGNCCPVPVYNVAEGKLSLPGGFLLPLSISFM